MIIKYSSNNPTIPIRIVQMSLAVINADFFEQKYNKITWLYCQLRNKSEYETT